MSRGRHVSAFSRAGSPRALRGTEPGADPTPSVVSEPEHEEPKEQHESEAPAEPTAETAGPPEDEAADIEAADDAERGDAGVSPILEADQPDDSDAEPAPPELADDGIPPTRPADGPAVSPQRPRRSNRTAFALVAVAVVGLVAVNVVRWATDANWTDVAPQPAPLGQDGSGSVSRPAFTLTDLEGRPFDFVAETSQQLTFLFFGYTSCPDVCPITMATLTSALDQLPGTAATVVFVTTDPSRDTPERLNQWLGSFSGNLVALTGSAAELEAAQKAAGVSTAIAEAPDEKGNYLVGHSASVLVYTPDDRLYGTVPSGTTQSEWMDAIRATAARR